MRFFESLDSGFTIRRSLFGQLDALRLKFRLLLLKKLSLDVLESRDRTLSLRLEFG